jgi:acyl carrier protein
VSTADRIRAIVIEETHWDGPPDALSDGYLLVEQQLLDSLALMRLITRLEDSFGIEVPDDDVLPSNFASIGQIAAYVDRRTA